MVKKRFPFFPAIMTSLNPILALRGKEREDQWMEKLSAEIRPILGEATWERFLKEMECCAVGDRIFVREMPINGTIGDFELNGRIDFLILRWEGEVPVLRVVECKASRKDRTYHRVQVATYLLLLQHLLKDGITVAGEIRHPLVEGVVARIDEETGENQNPMELPSLDLEQEKLDVMALLAIDGQMSRIAAAGLDDLPYQLGPKCDSCVNCPICLPESARNHSLELLGLDLSTISTLREFGIKDLDGLAAIESNQERVKMIQSRVGFNQDIPNLCVRAKARRYTLPSAGGRNQDVKEYAAMPLPHQNLSQLPGHEGDGGQLVRVYLNVEYDYIEDRLLALSAHITDSSFQSRTVFEGAPGEKKPSTQLVEAQIGCKEGGRPLQGLDIRSMIRSAWTGNIRKDSALEEAMLLDFFHQLVATIPQVAKNDALRRLHFYVWADGDMTALVAACGRVGGRALRALTELLGCRPRCQGDNEQLIFSAISRELDGQMGLGYTGRSLAIVSSLGWYGAPYHWVRQVQGSAVGLDKVFRRDIFDFRMPLYQKEDGTWSKLGDPTGLRAEYEIRTRFSSDISIPYWYVMWGILDRLEGDPKREASKALAPYLEGGNAPMIEAMLAAKAHALRWVEERLRTNPYINKPLLPVRQLVSAEALFDTRYDLVNAALDFMRLDNHVAKVEWIGQHLLAPSTRVSQGLSIPLKDVHVVATPSGRRIEGLLDLEVYELTMESFLSSCPYVEGDMVRLTPYDGEPFQGQSQSQLLDSGLTCMLDAFDATTGRVALSVIPGNYRDPVDSGYIPKSVLGKEFSSNFALVDESLAQFVKMRADGWLNSHRKAPSLQWFTDVNNMPPQIQPDRSKLAKCRKVLAGLSKHTRGLDDIQVEACLEGLGARIQLLLGPPGTGKTNTAAAAILLRMAVDQQRKLFLVGTNTNTAVDELISRVQEMAPWFRKELLDAGFPDHSVRAIRLTRDATGADGEFWDKDWKGVQQLLRQSNLVLGGTTSSLLKMAKEAENSGASIDADSLIVDEASMMVFPEFLAISTLIKANGNIMLAGDQMQLAPIVAHNWESEDREQVTRMLPYESAYLAVRRLRTSSHDGRVLQSALTRTYRLKPEVRDLIARAYIEEGVRLTCAKEQVEKSGGINCLGDIWKHEGVFLLVHEEDGSSKINEFEADLIEEILDSREGKESERPPKGVAIITPHRAQRSLLKRRFEGRHSYDLKMIDTVERMQGGECGTIIVSGTQSDPMAISQMAEFILNLNRTNVIFSRTQERLIVVCSSTLLDAVPPDIDDYHSAMLWKHLRAVCDTTAMKFQLQDRTVQVRVSSHYWKNE
jgi:hypothetical protein